MNKKTRGNIILCQTEETEFFKLNYFAGILFLGGFRSSLGYSKGKGITVTKGFP